MKISPLRLVLCASLGALSCAASACSSTGLATRTEERRLLDSDGLRVSMFVDRLQSAWRVARIRVSSEDQSVQVLGFEAVAFRDDNRNGELDPEEQVGAWNATSATPGSFLETTGMLSWRHFHQGSTIPIRGRVVVQHAAGTLEVSGILAE